MKVYTVNRSDFSNCKALHESENQDEFWVQPQKVNVKKSAIGKVEGDELLVRERTGEQHAVKDSLKSQGDRFRFTSKEGRKISIEKEKVKSVTIP